jgi:hypothetical protein
MKKSINKIIYLKKFYKSIFINKIIFKKISFKIMKSINKISYHKNPLIMAKKSSNQHISPRTEK